MCGFADGLAEQVSGKLLGGDITVCKGGPLTISVTAIGEVPAGKMVRRNGAQTGDQIFICGPIGTRAAGLKCASDPDWAKSCGLENGEIELLAADYRAPRVMDASKVTRLLRDNATAALDVSDGLTIDLERLCAASDVGAQIELDAILLQETVRKLINQSCFSIQEAITGGDDYVALFTVDPDKVDRMLAAGQPNCTRIGTIVDSNAGVTFLTADGMPLSLGDRKGYDHFSQ